MCKHVLSPASIEENNIFKDIVPIHRWGVSGYITTSSDGKIAKDKKDIPLFEGISSGSLGGAMPVQSTPCFEINEPSEEW